MSPRDAVRDLARLIEETSGNVIPPGHFPFLAEVASRRTAARGIGDVESYVRALERGALDGEWRHLLPLVTIKESYLFRTPQHFLALAAVALPALMRERTQRRTLSVWSAGCARGEEPATLAIVLAEHEALSGWQWRIDATDVDEDALACARRAQFGERAVAHVPRPLLDSFFTRTGDLYELQAAVAERINCRFLNLIREPFPIPAEPYDLIFLRNVLIYFRPESQRRVVAGVARALAPDGYLFLGPSETLWQLSDELEPLDLGDCFCYRHRSQATAAAASNRAVRQRQHATPSPEKRRPAPVPSAPPMPRPDPRHAGPEPRPMAADGTERSSSDRLQAASALLADNRLDEATELVAEVLRIDPSEPDAHAFDGFLHDLAGRPQQAIASYRAALFLEPGLFQIRTLLAESLRRLGWHDRAAKEYRDVLALLQSGRGREVASTAALPMPDRAQAERLCRQGLQRR
jgi:chemotaxis protein methyltransferase CheR